MGAFLTNNLLKGRKMNYKKEDRIVINIGTVKEPCFYVGKITGIKKDFSQFKILFDDGDEEVYAAKYIVGVTFHSKYVKEIPKSKLGEFIEEDEGGEKDVFITHEELKEIQKTTKLVEEEKMEDLILKEVQKLSDSIILAVNRINELESRKESFNGLNNRLEEAINRIGFLEKESAQLSIHIDAVIKEWEIQSVKLANLEKNIKPKSIPPVRGPGGKFVKAVKLVEGYQPLEDSEKNLFFDSTQSEAIINKINKSSIKESDEVELDKS